MSSPAGLSHGIVLIDIALFFISDCVGQVRDRGFRDRCDCFFFFFLLVLEKANLEQKILCVSILNYFFKEEIENFINLRLKKFYLPFII